MDQEYCIPHNKRPQVAGADTEELNVIMDGPPRVLSFYFGSDC
jgi:hypothetical protein